MTIEHSELKSAFQQIVQQFGVWKADYIELAPDIFTKSPPDFMKALRVKRIIQMVQDVARRPLGELRILDLGSLEGGYSIELGLHGADVVGIEARTPSIEKARFAQQVLGLNRVTFLQEDVRGPSLERHGTFDVVLCLGILYHLEAPDAFRLLERIYKICDEFLVVNIRTMPEPLNYKVQYGSLTVSGWRHEEHKENDTPAVRSSRISSSLDNAWSFWIDRDSLCKVLYHVGFTNVLEFRPPRGVEQFPNRITFVAFKGNHLHHLSLPGLNSFPEVDAKLSVSLPPEPVIQSRMSWWKRKIKSIFRHFGYDAVRIQKG